LEGSTTLELTMLFSLEDATAELVKDPETDGADRLTADELSTGLTI